ncbi:MAG: NAD(P)H-dependent flavin oxidoreductase [Vicinamibacterales bacterium]
MQTRLTDRLHITHPVIQAPMSGGDGPELAAAVSEAGGLGMLALWRHAPDAVRAAIRHVRERTDRPFGVNLNLAWPQEERLEICLEAGVPIVSFFWGTSRALVTRARAGGATVLESVGSADEARAAVDRGADVVVAQGWEAGGHVWGTVATMALVPAVVDVVGDVPVVAAGGMADGRGLAAALALGAGGVWLGTRFLATPEAAIHPRYRERLLSADASDARWFENLFDIGWPHAPHRALGNDTVAAWEAAGRPPSGARPGEGDVLAVAASGAPVRRYQSHTPGPQTAGDIDNLSLWAGQGVGLVTDVRPAREVVLALVEEAESVLRGLTAPRP